ncbi:hypothetical protein I203_108393 [Kwoniella mangroviensis CBS 8507]|uniref:hypothetical protein n=1 Tax=Kwoniella mangroviensis CBS 8507 TaxID=1296122 RepID=UPI00080D0205|nr:uncharacterized protein I203_05288 [Kwoniella mangroviensis CBS 8507]OCF65610.1 hypothetical protein I203_05288 [Kwoniella mangroviensis CBS 8507]
MSQSTPNPDDPSSESLSLSASIFYSSIDSWIPSNFGTSSSSQSKKDEGLTNLLRPDIRGQTEDRLGLGHPLLDNPSASRQIQRNGLVGLSKKLNLEKKKGKEKQEVNGKGARYEDDEDEDEEESKFKLSNQNKKKVNAVDSFSTGKGKKKKDPFSIGNNNNTVLHPAILAQQLNNRNNPEEDEDEREEEDEPSFPLPSRHTTPVQIPPTSSPRGSGIFPYDGPRPFGSPVKSKNSKRSIEDDDGEQGEKDESNGQVNQAYDQLKANESGSQESPVKSKSAMRREKRKRAKLNNSSKE